MPRSPTALLTWQQADRAAAGRRRRGSGEEWWGVDMAGGSRVDGFCCNNGHYTQVSCTLCDL